MMRSIPTPEEVAQVELGATLDTVPVHPPLSAPGALRVLLCASSAFAALPAEGVEQLRSITHGLVQVQVPCEPPLKKEELFRESKWVWPQNVLASGPPPPSPPNAAETRVMLRCMRQAWAAALAAAAKGVNPSLCACLIHDPIADTVMAVDVSAARDRMPRTTTAGVSLADEGGLPGDLAFRATPAGTPSADSPRVAVATADSQVVAASALRSSQVTAQLPALCDKYGLSLLSPDKQETYMQGQVPHMVPPQPVAAPPPPRHDAGKPPTPIMTTDGPIHITDSLEGPPAVKRQRTDDILPGGNVHRGITVPHPDPAHTERELGDAFGQALPLPLSTLHTAVMRCVQQVAAQDKVRHETGHPPYAHRAAFANSVPVVPGDAHVPRAPSPPRDLHAPAGGGDAAATSSGSQAAASGAASPPSSPASQGSGEDSDGPPSRYLCTGFDVYLTFEPEPMDAMALVHARVRRVVYCLPNLSEGALGTRLMLHEQRQLNHHYRVFRVLEAPQTILKYGAPPPLPAPGSAAAAV